MSLPVTILSGYLGAGKTTLVNALLRQADGRRIAVMVNEFGDLPIDADLIEAEGDDLIALAGGCVCCSYGDDLMAALARIATLDPAPDHVVLEASGVALPGAIASSLTLVQGIKPSGVVVLADAQQIDEQLANEYIGDTVVRQLRAADLVVVSKGDLVTSQRAAAVASLVTEHAGRAMLIQAAQGAVPIELILSPKAPMPARSDQAHGDATGLTRRTDRPAGRIDARAYARDLAERTEVIRAKGHVDTDAGLCTVQIVGSQWAVTPAPSGADVGVVVITLSP
ncbi:GTP-binding protein [Sulfitobacter albidus]|uniref:GTP-binding protein n=1 Tax=Sulfitobacter albidus TaxID=2829501 RepID=A0A975PNX3_9RHOB|nr:GTP-binding protein [Sulfitobacter albidus]QUJ78273.1 GTP-binding protein [Sulfitobacter albidus]